MLKQVEERNRYAKETQRTSAELKRARCEPTSMNFCLIKNFPGCQFFSDWIHSAPRLPGALSAVRAALPTLRMPPWYPSVRSHQG